MSRKEDLEQIIAEAQAELDQIESTIPEPILETDSGEMQSCSDYQYWKGVSLIGIDIKTGKRLPFFCAKHVVTLSYCEMKSSEQMNLRIVHYWKQYPVIERGEVTHFVKKDFVEKRYTYDWGELTG